MNFASVPYFIFFAVVFVVYWSLSRRYQNILLLLASYFFYAYWDWRFLGLIIISTLTDYICGPLIYNTNSSKRKKLFLIIALSINLGILGYFKYFNFFADSFIALADTIGWHVSWTTARIILPVGISFFTFQSISYSIDIYRGKLKPTKSLIDFAAFVAFFPQLVAGPIVRAKEFVHQLKEERHFSGSDLEQGLTRFLYGFFKKAFVADTLAIYLVDPVFADPSAYSSGTLWIAIFGWAIQIYADFSGYSNMAIGSAKMLGFTIPENFNFPYLSYNISQYWRRWHMTMSRFFRDYVYFGLGGNRKGKGRSLINIAITTFVSGLWHGAAWTFVCWGWLHGIYIVIYQTFRDWRKKLGIYNEKPKLLYIIPAWIVTQLAVSLSRILFRSPDFQTAWDYTRGLFASPGQAGIDIPFLVWVGIVSIFIDHIYGWLKEHKPKLAAPAPASVRAVAYASMIIFISHAIPEQVNPYIYFQF